MEGIDFHHRFSPIFLAIIEVVKSFLAKKQIFGYLDTVFVFCDSYGIYCMSTFIRDFIHHFTKVCVHEAPCFPSVDVCGGFIHTQQM